MSFHHSCEHANKYMVCGPLEVHITSPACNFGYMHTGVLWVLCMFIDHRIARYRMHTLKSSVRFMRGHHTGSCGFHMGLGIRLCMRVPCGYYKRVWQYPYDQSYRAVQGPMRPARQPTTYLSRRSTCLLPAQKTVRV